MDVVVYDSYTRRKQPLIPADRPDKRVSIYVCGPTVYGPIHVGNARTYVSFLQFARYLRYVGWDVTLVSNITDINDKIYAAAREAGIGSAELATSATAQYVADTNRLGIGRPDHEPTATGNVQAIIDLIGELIDRGLAYEVGGDVYFRVGRFPKYGRLSNQQPEELLAGSREGLEEAEGAESPVDFALWKATKPGEDTSWDSPWGKGRPGWHIECSAMAEQLLGPEFDVHAGGLDLIFPHHENEVAQSQGAGRRFARLWMHGGLLEFGDSGKMSKSEGNLVTLSDALDAWPTWVFLLFCMGASYRNPLAFSEEALEETRTSGMRITEALRRADRYLKTVETRGTGDPGHADARRNWEGIHEALHDDFNTANALGEVFGLVYDLNTAVNERATPQLVRDLRATLHQFLEVFALEGIIPGEVEIPADVAEMLIARDEARRKKDFEGSDALRDQIAERGFLVRDTPDGVDVVPREDG